MVCVEVPQSIAIESGPVYIHDETLETIFTVTSNGWLDLSFTGTSRDDNGQLLDYPRFHKLDVDASGDIISNQYDHPHVFWGRPDGSCVLS